MYLPYIKQLREPVLKVYTLYSGGTVDPQKNNWLINDEQNSSLITQVGNDIQTTQIYAINSIDLSSSYIDPPELDGDFTLISLANLTALNLNDEESIGDIYLPALPVIITLNVNSCNLSSLPTLGATMTNLYANSNSLTSFNAATYTILRVLHLASNPITSITNLPATIVNIDIADCQLSQASLDAIAASLDAGGEINGYFDCRNNTGTLSAAGITSVNNLISRGWSVFTN